MEIVQAVKKLNSISRERLNFRRRPFLCTTLYRNPTQANKFDQFFFWIFMQISYKMRLYFFYTMLQKSKKMAKNSYQWGPALILCSCFFSVLTEMWCIILRPLLRLFLQKKKTEWSSPWSWSFANPLFSIGCLTWVEEKSCRTVPRWFLNV